MILTLCKHVQVCWLNFVCIQMGNDASYTERLLSSFEEYYK